MKEKFKLEKHIEELKDNVCQSQTTATSLLDKMKNKLIKTKALLKDERTKDQGTAKETNKILLRKLKNQVFAYLEDLSLLIVFCFYKYLFKNLFQYY